MDQGSTPLDARTHDGDEPTPPSEGRRSRRDRRGNASGPGRPWLRRTAWVAGSLALLLVLTAGFAYWRLNGNISRVDVSKMLGQRPSASGGAASSGPLNILVLGSDTRKNIGTTQFGSDTIEGGDHSDTNLLVHLSADRKSITVVSIPRDSMVAGPKNCSATDPISDWEVRQWNYNYHLGGPGCTIRTLEGNTGIYVNHYAVVNFLGFKGMVDALGGVQVCTNDAINDPESGLKLTAGRHTLMGEDALGYVRVRKTITGGSDLNRIKRQQAFMSSIAQKATETSLLLRPDKLYSFLDAATKSLTTDPGLDVGTMRDVAQSIQKVGTQNIQFVTVPIETYPADTNRVQWTSSANQLWAAIKADRPVNQTPSPSPSATATKDTTPLTVAPDQIAVRVVNTSGASGLATQTGQALGVQGFQVVAYADDAQTQGATVSYSAGMKESARTVAAALPGAKLVEVQGLGSVVQVSMGVGAPRVVAVPNRLGTEPIPTPSVSSSPSSSQAPIETRTADQDICS